jgi:hypothetical protein
LSSDSACLIIELFQGTWQFISVHLLQSNEAVHSLADDRESSLHLLVWMALRYTACNLCPQDVVALLQGFDERHIGLETAKGGSTKGMWMLSRQIPKRVRFTDRPALDALIADLTELLATRYTPPPAMPPEDTTMQMDPEERIALTYFARQYQEKMAQIEDRPDFDEIFRRHLSNRTAWPDSDRPLAEPFEREFISKYLPRSVRFDKASQKSSKRPFDALQEETTSQDSEEEEGGGKKRLDRRTKPAAKKIKKSSSRRK